MLSSFRAISAAAAVARLQTPAIAIAATASSPLPLCVYACGGGGVSVLSFRGTKSGRGGRHAWPKPQAWPPEYEDPVAHKADFQQLKESGEFDRKKVTYVT